MSVQWGFLHTGYTHSCKLNIITVNHWYRIPSQSEPYLHRSNSLADVGLLGLCLVFPILLVTSIWVFYGLILKPAYLRVQSPQGTQSPKINTAFDDSPKLTNKKSFTPSGLNSRCLSLLSEHWLHRLFPAGSPSTTYCTLVFHPSWASLHFPVPWVEH